MALFEHWARVFSRWSEALTAEPSPATEDHLPFLRDEVFWPRVMTLVGSLIRPPARDAAAELAARIGVLDVFAPVCSEGGRPPLRQRLAVLDQPQRQAVAALMETLGAPDWITGPWQEAARIDGDDWLTKVTPVDAGRLVWWWRKAKALEESLAEEALMTHPVMTSYRRDLAEVALRVEAAFDGVAPPGRVTLKYAQALERGEDRPEELGHRGRWQDIPLAELLECPHALSHLDDDGLHYYAPRLMLEALRWMECSNRELLSICDEFIVRWDRGLDEGLTRFTPTQVEACAAFVKTRDWLNT